MARLQFCDYHNMVAILEKGEFNTDFYPRIVPLFDTMLVHQGEGSGTPTEPHHTPSLEADTSHPTTSSIPLPSLPTAHIPPIQQGEGSGTTTKPHHTPTQEAHPSSHTYISSPSIPTVTSIPTIPIPTVIPSETTPIRQYTQRARIAQSSALIPVANELASPVRDDSQGEACPTDSGFIADQNRATIAKSSTLPHDSAPRPAKATFRATCPISSSEGGNQQVEGKSHAVRRKRRSCCTNSRDDAPIKGRSMDKGEAATERVSDDTKEMAIVLTSMDAATVLASGVVDVPTGSGSIPTASTPAEGSVPTGSEEVPTASPVFATATVVTPVTRIKGKEVMMKSETPKKKKVQEQIDRELEEHLEKEDLRRAEQIVRDTAIARIHAEEEIQSMIDGLDSNNETVVKY
nr:hypothetical protein [Tanacetum cinerariifolium]